MDLIRSKYLMFQDKLKEQGYKQIKKLMLIEFFQLSILVTVYLLWFELAKVGFNNLYGIYKFFSERNELREPLNELGVQLISIVFFGMFLLLIIQTMILVAFDSPRNYRDLLRPQKRLMKSFCINGTTLFLLAVYTNEIQWNSYAHLTTKLYMFVSMYLLLRVIEKKIFKDIEKSVLNDIVKEKFSLKMPVGYLEIDLAVFKQDSVWKKYIYRSKENQFKGSYNDELQRSLSDVRALYVGEEMILKGTLRDYVIRYPKINRLK